jgi:hypothetical protein
LTELQDWNRNKLKLHAIFFIAGVATICILARAFTNLGVCSLTPVGLIKEASRSLKLAVQDTDNDTKVIHSAQGLAFIGLARKLASDSSLEKSTGKVVSELEKLFQEIIEKKSH